MTPTHRIADPADVSVVRFQRDKARHLVGKGAEVRAWAMIDADGELSGVLLQASCNLCPFVLREDGTPEVLADRWAVHYDSHDVNGKADA